MIDDTLNEAEEKMDKAVEVAREDFAAIRTGRANPAMFNKIIVDYYGTPDPAAAARVVHGARGRGWSIITPYDKGALAAIEKAIRDSDLGVNPTNDGKIIRVRLPRADRGAPQGVHQGRARPRPRTAGSRSATSAATPSRRWSKLEKDGEVGKDDVTGAEKRLDGADQEAHRRRSTSCSSTRKPSCSRSSSMLPDESRATPPAPSARVP